MNSLAFISLIQMGLSMAPTVVQSVEVLFAKKTNAATPADTAAQSAAKAQAALNMAVAGISVALGVDPSAFGVNEKALITAIHNDVVAYFNAKGWPVA